MPQLPVYVSSASSSVQAWGDAVVTLPSLSSGRFYMAIVSSVNGAPATPTGWTNATPAINSFTTIELHKTFLYYKFWNTGDATTVTFPAETPTNHYRDVYVLCFDGVDAVTPIHQIASSITTSSTTLTMPSVTTTVNNSLVINYLSCDRTTDDYSWLIDRNANTSLGTATIVISFDRWQGATQYAWVASKVTAGVVNSTTCTAQSGYTYGALGVTIALTPSMNTNLVADPIIPLVINGTSSDLIVSRVLQAGSATLTLFPQSSELTTQKNVFAEGLLNLNNVVSNSSANLYDYTTLNTTLSNVSLNSSANLKISANIAKTLSNVVSNSSAKNLIQATASKTLDNITLNSLGQFYRSSSIEATLQPLTGMIYSNLKLSSVVSQSLSNVSSNSSGVLKTNGTLNKTLNSATSVSTAVPFLFKNASLNVTLGSLSVVASEYINIEPQGFFTPPSGYFLYETRFVKTEPQIVYFSKDYAALVDTPTTALGSYGEVNSFKILVTVEAIYKNSIDNSLILTEKKKFRFEVLPDWSIMRDQTIIDYFEGKTLSDLPPAEFIDYMKSLGYYL